MPIVNIKGTNKQVKFPDDMTREQMQAILQKQFTDRLLSRPTLQNRPQTVDPQTRSLAERAGQSVSDFLYDKGIVSNRQGAQDVGSTLSALGELLPGVGDATAGDEFGRALAEGDKFGMGMGMLGAVPVLGDLAKKGVKKAGDVIESLPMDEAKKGARKINKNLPDYEELTLFHGTNKQFDDFDVDAVGDFSSRDTAGNISMTPFFDEADSYSRGESFSGSKGSPRVIQSDFKGRVKVVDDLDEFDAYEMIEIEDKARKDGFDAVYYSGIQDSSFYNPMGSTDTVKILNPESIIQKNKNFTRDDYKKEKYLSFAGKGKYSEDELKDLLKISDDDIYRYKNQSLPMDETKGKLTEAQKIDIINDYAKTNPKAMARIHKKRGKKNTQQIYADVAAKKSYKPPAPTKYSEATEVDLMGIRGVDKVLKEKGFLLVDDSVGKYGGLPSYSGYYKNPKTGAMVRLSDHAPSANRSTGNDIFIHPGSGIDTTNDLNKILDRAAKERPIKQIGYDPK